MTKYAEVVDGTVVSISAYPEAHRVAVDDSVFFGFTDNGDGTFSAPAAPAKTDEDVNTERDRRIEVGNEFTLSSGTTIAITGRERDKTELLAQFLKAKELDAGGETGAVMVYRDRDNVNRMLTPQEMIELFTLGMAWVEAVMKVAWDMKDGTGAHTAGTPDDLEDEIYWP